MFLVTLVVGVTSRCTPQSSSFFWRWSMVQFAVGEEYSGQRSMMFVVTELDGRDLYRVEQKEDHQIISV